MPIELSGYTSAWLIYLLSATGCLIIFWRMTRRLVLRRSRRVLRIIVAVVLLTPTTVSGLGSWLAPAFLVAGYELALGNFDVAILPLLLIASAGTCMVLFVMLESVLRRLLGLQVERS
jgi:hypothetical protein